MKHFNSITIAIAIALMGFTSCSDDDFDGNRDNGKTEPPKEQNKYATKIDLSASYPLTKPMPTFENERYQVLGYGYDITGKYAHPDWIRKKVVDPQKLKDDYPGEEAIQAWRVLSHGPTITKTGTKSEVKAKLFENMRITTNNISTEYKNAFRGIFDGSFNNDTTFTNISYHYVLSAFVSCWYQYNFVLFRDKEFLRLRNYLTEEFKSDMESKPAEEIVKLYGTHVMADVKLGWRLEVCYRSSSNDDLYQRMRNAHDRFLNSNSSAWMSSEPNPYHEKENLYAEYVSGVDPIGEANAWMFDITNYEGKVKFDVREHAIEDESVVLVNWGSRSHLGPLIPIYEFISDTAKREAIEQAFKEYLSK